MPENSNNIVIKASELSKRYKELIAVDNISFTVERGKCFGFLGPNGAGKSTTMKMIYGLSPVTEGELHVLGLNAKKDISKIKARLGVVPQENNLDPDLNVYENLIVYANYFGMQKNKAVEKAHELLRFVNLEDKADKKADKLSGGMKRRLIIARALINDPDIVILDEPTTGLDPQARHLLWDKMFELKSKNKTLILTTHYMEEAAYLCDHIFIMDKGKIITQGSPKELINNNLPHFVLEYNGDRTLDDTLIGLLGDNLDSYQKTFANLLLFVRDSKLAVAELKLYETHLHSRRPNLEDVFIKLTGREIAEGE